MCVCVCVCVCVHVQDLEFLIDKAVDSSKANYAVVTGVQVGGVAHAWMHAQRTGQGVMRHAVLPPALACLPRPQRRSFNASGPRI